VSFRINTNIASLQAQDYLQANSEFQTKTISRVTSGLRIVSSGDDAAGLAIANGFRSDQAVLSQGVRNANDGLSQLQIADGGISNISKLLDRARTLATQSASGTFTGDRSVLNGEFASVIGEIDRQSQVIGLNQGGTFAKSLSVFIGGGKDSNGTTAITNGSVTVDLSNSAVDSKNLGLKGVQASGVAATDIGVGATSTRVADILANATNTGSEAAGGFTDFYFTGPGFSDSSKVRVSVNLAGVTDTNTLVAAINSAIQSTGTGGSQAATAFKNANIAAGFNTDLQGRQQLIFNSSTAAFQVQAGDRVANAVLGNFTSGSTGKDLTSTVAGVTTTATALAGAVVLRIQGSGLATAVDITIAAGTAQAGLDSLYTQVSQNAALQAAGITVNHATAATDALTFTNKRGESFNVQVAGDTKNTLGTGTFYQSGGLFDYTSITAGAALTLNGAKTDKLEFSIGGGVVAQISVTTGAANETNQIVVDNLNTQLASNAATAAAGLKATQVAGVITLTSANGTAFRVREAGGVAANQILGFATGSVSDAALGAGVTGTAGTTTVADNTNNVHVDAGGESATSTFQFSPILNGQDAQTLTFTAQDASGVDHTTQVVLQNNGTARNARSLDEAIATINKQLVQSNDSTLKQVVAVKEYIDTTHEGIRFVSTLSKFNVSLSAAGTGGAVGVGVAADQGKVISSTVTAGGSVADISSQSAAQAAVTALATAVSTLGKAQAVVGRGQNQFGYAINLAQSQLTNLASAESRIRDADLASEAANLTKAQVLLQAGVAALAQANSAPQAVLALLRG
jgi:flagellin